MSLKLRRRALLVTGMHRSGTSCVTRIANLAGLAVGSNLLPPQDDNPLGFWEHAGVSAINNEILVSCGTSWDGLTPLPDGWVDRADVGEHKQALREIIQRDFTEESQLVIKDPRLCLLVPMWRELLTELDYEVQFLIVMRDLRSVVASLARRNHFPPWHSELLWLRYNLMAEYQTRDDRRALVHYEDIVRDWRSTFGKVVGTIPLSLPDPGSEASAAIEDFVKPEMNHAPATDPDQPAEMSPWSHIVTDAFAREAALEDTSARDALDGVRTEFLAADPLLAPQDRHWRDEYLRLQKNADVVSVLDTRFAVIGDSWQTRMDAIVDHVASDRQTIDLLISRFDSLEAEAQNRDQGIITTLTQERDDLRVKFAALESTRQHLETELARVAAAEPDQLAQIEALTDDLSVAQEQILEARVREKENKNDFEESVEQLRDELSALQSEFIRTQEDLHAHTEVLANMVNSRSWRITRPLRELAALSPFGSQERGDLDLIRPVPWHELLPGRAFRQSFQSPHRRLASFGIGFFAYARENSTTVRIRLFEKLRIGRANVLIEEFLLEGDDIRDGEVSAITLKKAIRDADTRKFVIEIESLDGEPGKTVTVALGRAGYPGKILSRDRRGESETRGLLVLEMRTHLMKPKKAFAFISGCPGGAYRYRCLHQAETLRLRGYAVDVFPADEFHWDKLLEGYQVVVAHRVPHTAEFESFVEDAKGRDVHVVFDTDDLVFAPEVEDQIAALDDLSEPERELWLEGVHRYRQSLSLVDKAMVSTTALKRSLESRLGKQVGVSRNRLIDEMVEQAEAAENKRSRDDEFIRIGYLSGTPTHRRDFAECVSALATIMRNEPHVRLTLIGHIDLPSDLSEFSERVDFMPLVPWEDLPKIYTQIDINLAPLERDNEFTEGKSELKYFEAALLGVPTVASRIGSYIDAIRHGEDGYLCDSTDEWVSALERLVSSGEERERIGQAAKTRVHERYTSRGAASETVETWLDLLGPRSDANVPLTIAIVVRAPIANTGGGYKKVFHLVEYFSARGHDVSVYVEPIAHLEGKTPEEIEDFCRENFECGDAKIVTGHELIGDCDAAIATNWPTAYVVDELPNARQRFYFIQDDEREFYGVDDPLRAEAAATYDLPLLIVGIGRYLAQLMGERNQLSYPHVDFALSEIFFEQNDETLAKLDGIASASDSSLLFFARPGIPRRGFEMGVEALTSFQRERPDVEIRLYGLDEPLELPFEFVDLGVISQSQLATEMRNASAHLSFSRTNASTVIFEAMSCGAVAIELDVESVRTLIEDSSTCVLLEDSASAVSAGLVELFDDRERMSRIARAGFESVTTFTVDNMCRQFEEILLEHSLADRGLD